MLIERSSLILKKITKYYKIYCIESWAIFSLYKPHTKTNVTQTMNRNTIVLFKLQILLGLYNQKSLLVN